MNNCTFTNGSSIYNGTNFINCSYVNTNDERKQSLGQKIFVYTIMTILCLFLVIFVCTIFNEILKSLTCFSKKEIIDYKLDTYSFSMKNCTLIKPNDTHDTLSDGDCSICLDKLINFSDPNDIDDLLKINKCGHVFHSNCIFPWFNQRFRSAQQIDCPLCRTVLKSVYINIPYVVYSNDSGSE
jgi:hypothetical protein